MTQETPIYKDPKQPVEARVRDLLSRMTLEEKADQLLQGLIGKDVNPNNLGYDLEGVYVRGNNNGFLHSDGWDRIKNFRERKAELYFHNGGMEYAEEL